MRLRSIVLALLLIPLLAVSAGAIYIEGQAPPVLADGEYSILAADSGVASDGNLIATPTSNMGCNFGCGQCITKCIPCAQCAQCKIKTGPIITKTVIPPACTQSFCAPCFSPCFNPVPTGCTAESIVCKSVKSPAIVNSVPPCVLNNFCSLSQPCFAPFANVMVPV